MNHFGIRDLCELRVSGGFEADLDEDEPCSFHTFRIFITMEYCTQTTRSTHTFLFAGTHLIGSATHGLDTPNLVSAGLYPVTNL
jgi:hypothetical protein